MLPGLAQRSSTRVHRCALLACCWWRPAAGLESVSAVSAGAQGAPSRPRELKSSDDKAETESPSSPVTFC